MAERDDDEKPVASEGVRILGAEEAQAALDGDSGRVPPGRPRHGDRPSAPDTAARPSMTFPSSSAGPTWSAASDSASAPVQPDASEHPAGRQVQPGGTEAVPPLPHWSEPPTGAMPAIFVDDDAVESGTDDAWAALSGPGPRFRSEGADWDDADLRADLTDETAVLGVAAEVPPDSDAVFAEEVAARRRVSGRRTSAGSGPRSGSARARTRPAPTAPASPADTPPSPLGERDLPAALLTAGIIAVIAFACFVSGTTATGYLAAVILGVAAVELAQGLRSRGLKPASLVSLLGSVGLVLSARAYGVSAYPIFFGLVTIFSLLWFAWEITPGRPLLGVATTMFVFGYVGGLGGFAGLLLESGDGVGLILGAVICTVAYDVFGFFIGSQFGKSHIAPKISPNKTFEGTLAGMTASVVVGWAIVGGGIAGNGIHPWDSKSGLALGMLVAIGAFLGDLCESMLKRDLELKDFGTLLPGHGGVLDRFDALLFCLPITYYLALHLNVL